MSITEAFEGVVPPRPVSPAPAATRPLKPVAARKDRAVRRPHLVRRVARVVWLDGRDSWIAEERSPSAKTVFRTDYTADLDTVWKPYGMWAAAYRPVAALSALLLDAIKFCLIHPARGPLTLGAAFALYLYATH